MWILIEFLWIITLQKRNIIHFLQQSHLSSQILFMRYLQNQFSVCGKEILEGFHMVHISPLDYIPLIFLFTP